MTTHHTKIDVIAAGVVLIAATLLYLFTLDNGLRPDELTGGDLITHQYAQVEGRPSNAPGYPLYVMGGWIWFRLGRTALSWALNPIEILSLYSTWWALASLLLLYLILLRVNRGQWLPAGLLTAFYAITYFFWYYSVTTEQYTSAVLQTLLVIWLALRWDQAPRDTTLLWLAFICGTMLANMLTTLFILPPLLWFILFRRNMESPHLHLRQVQVSSSGISSLFLYHYLKRPKLIFQAVGLALLPLVSYAYVYIRGAQHPEWRGAGQWPSTWAWFMQFLTIQQGRDELAPGLTLHNFFTNEFPALMGHELTWLVFLGGLVGLACLGRRRAIFLYSTLAIYFIFSWAYRFGNWFQVIIPAYPIFIIGFAAGLRRISESTSQRVTQPLNPSASLPLRGLRRAGHPTTQNKIVHYSLFIVLIALLFYRFTTNLPRANQHNLPTDTGLDPGWALLADQPVTPALISGNFAERVALQYLTTVWGVVPSIYPTDAGDLTPPPNVDRAGLVTYISRAAAPSTTLQLAQVHPQAAGEQLIELESMPRYKLPQAATPLNVDFAGQLKLAGWEPVKEAQFLPDDVAKRLPRANWQIALYWQSLQKLNANYTISVRPLAGGQLITENGTPLIQDHQPVWGFYPTNRWVPGELVRDVYALTLPEGIRPDAAQIIIYQTTETGFENLAETTIVLK